MKVRRIFVLTVHYQHMTLRRQHRAVPHQPAWDSSVGGNELGLAHAAGKGGEPISPWPGVPRIGRSWGLGT